MSLTPSMYVGAVMYTNARNAVAIIINSIDHKRHNSVTIKNTNPTATVAISIAP